MFQNIFGIILNGGDNMKVWKVDLDWYLRPECLQDEEFTQEFKEVLELEEVNHEKK